MKLKVFFLLAATGLGVLGCYEPPDATTATFDVKTVPAVAKAKADGEQTVRIDVTLSGNNKNARDVSFTTTIGLFSNGQATVSSKTDALGNVSVYLKSTAAGTATVQVNIQGVLFQYIDVVFDKIAIDPREDALVVTPSSVNVPADGVSPLEVVAQLVGTKDYTAKDIFFTTTLGTFDNGTATISLKADSDGKVKARLKSDKDGTGMLQADASGGLIVYQDITFAAAAPDDLVINSEVFQGTSGPESPVALTLRLVRETGKPTPGYKPVFLAFDAIGNALGNFNTPVLTSENTYSVSFAIPSPAFEGAVTFKVTMDVGGKALEKVYGPLLFKKKS